MISKLIFPSNQTTYPVASQADSRTCCLAPFPPALPTYDRMAFPEQVRGGDWAGLRGLFSPTHDKEPRAVSVCVHACLHVCTCMYVCVSMALVWLWKFGEVLRWLWGWQRLFQRH